MLSSILLIIVFIIIAVLIFVTLTFNKLIRMNTLTKEAFSGVDVQLKRRHELIPNLVETVKGYAQHERTVFEKVTEARTKAINSATISEKGQTENTLTSAIRSLFALVESYPQLKANQSFLSLQKELSVIEDNIQLARRYYNGTIRDYNILVQSFPSNIVSGIFNYQQKDFFELDDIAERKVNEVKF